MYSRRKLCTQYEKRLMLCTHMYIVNIQYVLVGLGGEGEEMDTMF